MGLPIEIISALVVAAGVSAADAATPIDNIDRVGTLVEKFGIMAALLIYFLIRDYFRDKADQVDKLHRQVKQESLETYVRETLSNQLAQNSSILKTTVKTHDKMLEALERKTPCMAHAAHERTVEVKASREHNKVTATTRI